VPSGVTVPRSANNMRVVAARGAEL
jgi:hypothetical protein